MGQLTAVVTGAGAGIGRAISRRLIERGYRVVGMGRRAEGLAESARLLDGGTGHFVTRRVDVRDADALTCAFAAIGPIHTVIANAGIVRQARLGGADARGVWREVLAVNLDGVFHTLDAAVPHLTGSGRIVVVSSGLGKLGRAAFGAYAASKHGVLGLMKCVAKELAPRKITVNAVCPGWVDTAMAHADISSLACEGDRGTSEILAEVQAGIPIGRLVRPEEVAALVGWLVSEEAAAVTGEAFNISGGEFFA